MSLGAGLVSKIYALVSLSPLASPIFRRNLDVDRSNADVKDSNLNAEFPNFLDHSVKDAVCQTSCGISKIVAKLHTTSSFITIGHFKAALETGLCCVEVDYGIALRYEFSNSLSPVTQNQPIKDALAAFPKQSHTAFRCNTDPDSNSFGHLRYEDTWFCHFGVCISKF